MKSNINPGDDQSYADRGHEDDRDEGGELLETSKDLERSRRTFSMREIKHNSSSAAALDSAVRRAFSMRASSVSGGYHRIDLDHQLHYSRDINADHHHHVNFINAPHDQSGKILFESEAAIMYIKPTKFVKKKGSNILEACKRLFGF